MASKVTLDNLLVTLAPHHFWSFCLYMDGEFFGKRRKFLFKIAQVFQLVAEGKIARLSVQLPPRSGKSYITTLYSCWLIGRNPDGSVMRNSCTQTLYNKFSYDTREIIEGQRFKQVFPGIALSQNKSSVTGWNVKQAKQVTYFGSGVGGTIIGFGATLCAITDDLYKSLDDALSDVTNDKVIRWFESTHSSRIERNCPEIDIGTRWHKRDIFGTRELLYDDVVSISAMTPEGETFCDDVKTTEEYLEIKRITDKFIWEAEYMQHPIDLEGQVFTKFELFDQVPQGEAITIAYADTADEGLDRFAMPICKLINGKCYVIDVLFNRDNLTQIQPQVLAKIEQHNIDHLFIESNNAGAYFIRELRTMTSIRVIGVNNTTNKLVRILAQSGWIMQSFTFMRGMSTEYELFMDECSRLLRTSKKNDDAPDALAGLSAIVRRNFL